MNNILENIMNISSIRNYAANKIETCEPELLQMYVTLVQDYDEKIKKLEQQMLEQYGNSEWEKYI